MPDKSIREFVRERMHEGNGGRLHLHHVFYVTREAYPRKVVPPQLCAADRHRVVS